MKCLLETVAKIVLICITLCGIIPVNAKAADDTISHAYTAYYDYLQREMENLGQEVPEIDYYKTVMSSSPAPVYVDKILAAYLMDLTGDGVDELILKRHLVESISDPYASSKEWICVYTYDKGSIRRIGQSFQFWRESTSGGWSYYKPDGYIGDIISFYQKPWISDDCLYVCRGSDGKVYLADTEPSVFADPGLSFFAYDGSKMKEIVRFSSIFIPDWSIGPVGNQIHSDYGRFDWYINGQKVDISQAEFEARIDRYCGQEIIKLVNNDVNTVLTTLKKNLTSTYYQPSAWAVDSVAFAIENEYLPKYLQRNYDAPITRQDFCALLVTYYEKTTGSVITTRTDFQDVNDINISKIASLGIVNGVGNGMFKPNSTITRQDAAVMLTRLMNKLGIEGAMSSQTFSDVGSIAEYAKDSVRYVSGSGIMTGVTATTFYPLGQYTREQSVITLVRLLNTQSQIKSLHFEETSLSLLKSATQIIQPIVEADSGANRALIWTTSNPSAVTVNGLTGEITAIGEGQATITAATSNGLSASYTVNVLVPKYKVWADLPTTVEYTQNGKKLTMRVDTITALLGMDDLYSVEATVLEAEKYYDFGSISYDIYDSNNNFIRRGYDTCYESFPRAGDDIQFVINLQGLDLGKYYYIKFVSNAS